MKKDKANKYGPIPSHCIQFNHGKRCESCMLEYDRPDYILKECIALNDEKCSNYNEGIGYE